MRTLGAVTPTPEQVSILSEIGAGPRIIRGAAGSGKTTTAILRLHSLIGFFASRRRRMEREDPVRALVLTFNRTLRGYIDNLVESQVETPDEVDIEVSTFASWSRKRLGHPHIADNGERYDVIRRLGRGIPLEPEFLVDEVEYVLGRFLPDQRGRYLSARRRGRGTLPRVDESVRNAILTEVIAPYETWKASHGVVDWHDLAVELANNQVGEPYDIAIADECQDFSANELRAVNNQMKASHSLTLIIDSVQRIYARGHTWAEIGLSVRPEQIKHLKVNYRNTVEIARFASPLVAGVPMDDDGTLPDFRRSTRHGRLPVVLRGRFRHQMRWAIEYIQENVNLRTDSVAFLHPLGGGWFDYVRTILSQSGLRFVELSQRSDWPTGSENIGLATLYSAKGLEFDHVFVLGVNEETMKQVEGDEDRETKLRRLLAVGIGRAKTFVCLGCSNTDPAAVLDNLEVGTYELLEV